MKALFASLFSALICFSALGHNHVLKKGFIGQLIVDELVNPTSLAIAPDGRIFITQKGGEVLVIQDGILQDKPFVSIKVDEHGERGLGSLVFDPDFEKNGYIYVYYSVYNRNFNRLSRFTANGNLAIPKSETVIMDFDPLSGTIHNGGAMRFGLDGTLYISTGDGVKAPNAQDSSSLLGKMIRINSDGSIPEDNPFYGILEGKNRAIYAFGLRNSFTFDLDPVTGQILANDVGLSDWEEINDIRAGKNYGWPITEGLRQDEEVPSNYQDPLFAYPHANNAGCAVVGGAFYQPKTQVFPDEYMGKYFFSDYCRGIISVMDPGDGEILDTIAWGAKLTSNMVVSEDGDLYFLSFATGELWRITYVGDGSPFISQEPKDLLRVVGEEAQFSTIVYGEELKFQWYKNGNKIAGETADTLALGAVSLTDDGTQWHCVISNKLGTVTTRTAILSVTDNQRPLITIAKPIAGSKFSMGNRLNYEGSATDPEDGPLDKDQLEWKINFHHNVHFHPGLPSTSGISSGVYDIPEIGETDTNVWFRIHLKATDSEGLENESYVDVHPNIAKFRVNTRPQNLQIGLDGTFFPTPYSKPGVVGNKRVLTAPITQVRNDSMFRFVSWESGALENNKEFSVGSQAEYTATYEFEKIFFEGDGDGLLGKYYANIEFEEPKEFERIDGIIDFYWNWFSPIDNSRNDSCSIHWSGSILAPVSGQYTFSAEYDDAAKVQVYKAEVIDDLEGNGENTTANSIYLYAGERYNIDIWYIEKRWSCKMKLSWSYPDQGLQIIPQKFLYSTRVADSIDPKKDVSELMVFPNPVQNEMIISFRSFTESLERIDIYDSKGRLVKTIEHESNLNYYFINMWEFEQGIYTVKAYSDDQIYTSRFVRI